MDRVSKKKRSEIMGRVGSKNTRPEMILRRLLFGEGYRYRLHYKRLPGSPDLAFPSRKKVIFVHGCFWHGHNNCRYARLPKSNKDYWANKIAENKKRDRSNRAKLTREGWQSMVVWQCELKNTEKTLAKAERFLETK